LDDVKDLRSVLLVDSNRDTREMYAIALRAAGFRTIETEDARSGWEQAAILQPAAVITELRLGPGPDGIEFCARLKANDGTARVPIIMVTGWSRPDAHERAQRAGCFAVRVKPVTPDDLVALVVRILAGA